MPNHRRLWPNILQRRWGRILTDSSEPLISQFEPLSSGRRCRIRLATKNVCNNNPSAISILKSAKWLMRFKPQTWHELHLVFNGECLIYLILSMYLSRSLTDVLFLVFGEPKIISHPGEQSRFILFYSICKLLINTV